MTCSDLISAILCLAQEVVWVQEVGVIKKRKTQFQSQVACWRQSCQKFPPKVVSGRFVGLTSPLVNALIS